MSGNIDTLTLETFSIFMLTLKLQMLWEHYIVYATKRHISLFSIAVFQISYMLYSVFFPPYILMSRHMYTCVCRSSQALEHSGRSSSATCSVWQHSISEQWPPPPSNTMYLYEMIHTVTAVHTLQHQTTGHTQGIFKNFCKRRA